MCPSISAAQRNKSNEPPIVAPFTDFLLQCSILRHRVACIERSVDVARKPAQIVRRFTVTALMLAATPASSQEGVSFFDPFDSLDRERWFISDGWSNGDWMNCTWSRDAVAIEDGSLVLRYIAASDPSQGYLCGEVQTRPTFGFGTYEVRMRTMRGSGFNAAFFTYIGPVHERPHDEIDVEILLRDPGRATFNTYVSGSPENGGSAALDPDADAEFVHYAFTWDQDGIRWFVNGQEVHRTTDGTPRPSETQKIYASLWGSGTFTDWMGPFDASAVPMHLEIDWIGFTRLGETCVFPESILCTDQ